MKALGFTAGICVAFIASTSSSKADVWEFDRQGNVLLSPDEYESHNVYYDGNGFGDLPAPAVSKSSRSVNSAIYRPMAEGVAEVYAEDPAVAAAGLDAEEFVRVFVALIDQESRFNPRALSPKGARGLGQLMPETAALLGVEDPTEPMANLHGAARYLTAQLAEFGRVDWALAAYNAGPHRVMQFDGIPPYRETRDYVARIAAAADLTDAPASVRATTPHSEVGRALSTSLDPTALDEPTQGTVLEWKR